MRYTKRWLAGVAGLSLGLYAGMIPIASADPFSNLASGFTQAFTDAPDGDGDADMDVTFKDSRDDEAAKPHAARKLQGEAHGGNTSAGTLDADDSNGLNLGGIGATAPVLVCGNAVNVVGIGSKADCAGENGPKAGLNSASGTLSGDNSNGANIGGIAATAPIIVCGNGDNTAGVGAKARCRNVNGGSRGGGGNSSVGALNGGDSNGANIGGIAATAPIDICGNALNVIGIGADALCQGGSGGNGPGASGNTSGGQLDAGDSNGLNLGGIGATAPIILCGNALDVIGIGARAGCEGSHGGHSPSPPPGCGGHHPPPGCTPQQPPTCTGAGCNPPQPCS